MHTLFRTIWLLILLWQIGVFNRNHKFLFLCELSKTVSVYLNYDVDIKHSFWVNSTQGPPFYNFFLDLINVIGHLPVGYFCFLPWLKARSRLATCFFTFGDQRAQWMVEQPEGMWICEEAEVEKGLKSCCSRANACRTHAADLHANHLTRNYILQGRHRSTDSLPLPPRVSSSCFRISITQSLCHYKRKNSTLYPKWSKKFGTSGSFIVSPWLESNCQNGPWDPDALSGFKRESDMVRFEL